MAGRDDLSRPRVRRASSVHAIGTKRASARRKPSSVQSCRFSIAQPVFSALKYSSMTHRAVVIDDGFDVRKCRDLLRREQHALDRCFTFRRGCFEDMHSVTSSSDSAASGEDSGRLKVIVDQRTRSVATRSARGGCCLLACFFERTEIGTARNISAGCRASRRSIGTRSTVPFCFPCSEPSPSRSPRNRTGSYRGQFARVSAQRLAPESDAGGPRGAHPS